MTVRTGPPPLPDECPAVFYEVHVLRRGDYITVQASLVHRMPDGSLEYGFGSINEYVYEPGLLAHLLGDTIEARVQRAKAKVARAARQRIEKERRLEAAFEAVT